jgi:hypothetical protein
MIPYAAALPALAFCEAPASPGGRLHRWTLGIAGLLAGLSLVVYLRERRSEWSSLGTVATRNVPDGLPDPIPQDPTEVDVARCIRALSGPDDRLFVFGDRAVLYLLSDRRLAGLYPHLLPALAWFLGPETGPRLWSLIERVGRDHPRVVVTTPDILWWYGSHTPKVILDQFPDAKQFLLDGYRPSRRLGGYELWVAKD